MKSKRRFFGALAIVIAGFCVGGIAIGQEVNHPDANIFYRPGDGNVTLEIINNDIGILAILSQNELFNIGALDQGTALGVPVQVGAGDITFEGPGTDGLAVGVYDLGNLFDSGLTFQSANNANGTHSVVSDNLSNDLGQALINFTVSGSGVQTNVGFSVVTVAVPEPSSISCLAISSLVLLFRRKKRNANI